MKAKVLIVEDEREVGELIGMYLNKDGIDSALHETGEAGLAAFKAGKFDMVVLDINLPGIDGFEFLSMLRKISKVPVVIVSAREADEDMVLGLGIGADDFVTKPFSPKVLVARIRANLRRSAENNKESDSMIFFGPYSLDRDGYLLKRRGKRVSVPPRELKLLTYLVEHRGRVKTVDQIYEAVWGHKYGDVTTVSVHIQRLRKKIEDDPSRPAYIKTVHGMGYKFDSKAIREPHES